MFAVLRESDQLLYYRSTPNHDGVRRGAALWRDRYQK